MGVHKPSVLRFGWMLFLVLKAKLLPTFPDLVCCINLLACVLNVLVSHAPAGIVAMQQQPAMSPIDTLSTLCGG